MTKIMPFPTRVRTNGIWMSEGIERESATDQSVTEAETAEIFQKMETVPCERYEKCY